MWHQVLAGRLHLSIATFLEKPAARGPRTPPGPARLLRSSDRDVLEPYLLFVFGDQR